MILIIYIEIIEICEIGLIMHNYQNGKKDLRMKGLMQTAPPKDFLFMER